MHSYGFIHFTEKEARSRALIPAMRIFGVQIRDSLCRTGKNYLIESYTD